MARLTVHTVETAPEAAKPRVEAALKNNGFIPNLIGVLANAPEALAFYQEVGKLNAANSLTPGEVEVIQIIAARTNECGFLRGRPHQTGNPEKTPVRTIHQSLARVGGRRI